MFLPLRYDFLPLRHDFLPLRHDFLPLRYDFLPLRHDVFASAPRCFCLCFTNKQNFIFTVNVVLFVNEKYYKHLSLCSTASIVALQILSPRFSNFYPRFTDRKDFSFAVHVVPFPINNFHFLKTRAVPVIPAKAGIQEDSKSGFRIKSGMTWRKC